MPFSIALVWLAGQEGKALLRPKPQRQANKPTTTRTATKTATTWTCSRFQTIHGTAVCPNSLWSLWCKLRQLPGTRACGSNLILVEPHRAPPSGNSIWNVYGCRLAACTSKLQAPPTDCPKQNLSERGAENPCSHCPCITIKYKHHHILSNK